MKIGKQDAFKLQLLQVLDAILIWLAFMITAQFRDQIRSLIGEQKLAIDVLSQVDWVFFLAVPLLPLLLEKFGFYDRRTEKKTGAVIMQMLQAFLTMIALIALMSVVLKITLPSRVILLIGGIIAFIIVFLRDYFYTIRLRNRKFNEASKERVVFAGSKVEMEKLLGEIDPIVQSSWTIVELFDLDQRSTDELYLLLKEKSVQRVLFAAGHMQFDKVENAIEVCELQGVEAWLASNFIRTSITRPEFDSVGDKPMLVFRSTPTLSWELVCKKLMDRIGSLLIIIATSPFWIFAAIGIKLSDPSGPIFFSQLRAGRYGMPFRMWKFRTMVTNAEELLEKIKETHGNEMDGPVFKLDNDPRIFKFGALIRKLSIDELPQLLNVLKGDMSLVGPRPLPLYEVEAFSNISHRRRLSVKPGITCEWQAGGRNKITKFEDWVQMDLYYIDHWSLWYDIKLLCKTVPAVLFGKGAK